MLTIFSCNTNKQAVNDKFAGMWKLDKYETFDYALSVWVADATRIGYSGYILYDGKGHMGVQLMPMEYKNIDPNQDVDSLKSEDLKDLIRLYSSNYGYFASYIISDSVVEHTLLLASNPKRCGETLIRSFEFKGDTLILTPSIGIGEKKFRLRWIKL